MEQQHCLTPKLAVRLAAPHTWLASVYPAVFGELYCLLKGYPLTGTLAITLFWACVFMQSAVNTLNDYFDFVKGTDTADDNVEVSDAVLVYENIKPGQALALGLGYLVAAGLLALPALVTAGPATLIIGVIGGIAVWTYSGGILPISYLPIGEFVSGFVMGGLIPMGIVAAVSSTFDFSVLPAALPFIISIGLIMMTNNTSDIEKDRQAKRRTLPALLGRTKAVRLYRAAVWIWMALICLLPVWYIRWWGLISPAFFIVFARHTFVNLLQSPLEPQGRVKQMKGIITANLFGNGAYLLALAMVLFGGGTFG